MNTEQRIEVERKIVAFLFNTMAAAGWHVDYIFDGQDNVRYAEWTEAKVLDTVFSVDDATISFVKATGCRGRIRRSVYIVLGNSGWDCINHHAVSDPDNTEDDFEDVMKLVDTFAEQLEPDHFAPDPFAPKPPATITPEQAKKADEAIREALGGALDCKRVWSAWNTGTMGPDDFSRVADDPDSVAEIRNAVLQALGLNMET